MKKTLVINTAKTYNLAYDKLLVWASQQGDEVEGYGRQTKITPFDLLLADRVLISVIFSWDLDYTEELIKDALHYECEVSVGGPAIHVNGDYFKQAYPTIEVVMGQHPCDEVTVVDVPMTFTSRGCIRNCPWCIVPTIEGRVMRERDELHYAPLILDNNFLATSDAHQERVMRVWSGKKVDWNQGLDARLYAPSFRNLVTKHNVKPIVWRFAYDSGGMTRHVQRAIEDLRNSTVGDYRRIRVYLLFNHDETIEEAQSRAEEIIAWGASPWPMAFKPLDWRHTTPYVSPKWSKKNVSDFRRFYSRAWLWKSTSFDQYDPVRYEKLRA
tara:strand:+ start:75 stop:1052 length:978 start_codon:yes stop_codon:yes gene_type:complete